MTKIISQLNPRLYLDIIVSWKPNTRRLTIINYPMIIHLGLSCEIESHEPNTLQI